MSLTIGALVGPQRTLGLDSPCALANATFLRLTPTSTRRPGAICRRTGAEPRTYRQRKDLMAIPAPPRAPARGPVPIRRRRKVGPTQEVGRILAGVVRRLALASVVPSRCRRGAARGGR